MLAGGRGVAQEPAEKAAQALELFFELGLPDAKGAKWVHVEGPVHAPGVLEGGGRNYGGTAGNAWLLKEEPGEVLLVSGERVRTRILKENEQPPGGYGGEAWVNVAPADWANDAEAFLGRLKDAVKRSAASNEDDYRLAQIRAQCGPALLYLAQAMRRGDQKTVREAMPLLLQLGGGAAATLDAAVSELAGAGMRELAEKWAREGNAEAYAAGVEALVARFTRGWKERGGAALLVERLRRPKTSDESNPEVKEAATLLLSLKDLRSIPPRPMWMLPGVEGVVGEEGMDYEYQRAQRGARRKVPGGEEHDERVEKFFADSRKAAAILAKLIGDQRMVRTVPDRNLGGHWGYDQVDVGGADAEQAYASLARPKELGELCRELLLRVLPGKLQQGFSRSGGSGGVTEWVKQVESLSDQELAWEYLRAARRASDPQFQTALMFLADQSEGAWRTKLDEVFLDPAVWEDDTTATLVAALEKHVARREGEADSFRERLLANVKKARETKRKEQLRYMPEENEYRKQLEQQDAAMAKRIEQAFKPVNLEEILKGIVAEKEEEALTSLATLPGVLQKTPLAQAEAQLMQAAAKVGGVQVKAGMLRAFMQRIEAGEERLPDQVADDATRKAVAELLKDERVLPQGPWEPGESTVARTTAQALLAARWREGEESGASAVAAVDADLFGRWMMASAQALAAGSARPGLPEAEKVEEGRVAKIMSELAAAAPAECARIFRGKTLDEQYAVILHLRDPGTKWPESVRAAHLTIVGVTSVGGAEAPAWKGRVFDAAAEGEFTKMVEEAALKGESRYVQAVLGSVLEGVRVTVGKTEQKVTMGDLQRYRMELPEGSPPPSGVVSATVYGANRAIVIRPVWKEAAANAAWEEQERKQAEKPPEEAAMRSDPRGFKRTMKDLLEVAPAARSGPVQVVWYGAPMVEKSENSSEIEDEE